MKTLKIPDRYELIKLLPPGGVGVEVGVCHGDFSKMLLDSCAPSVLHLIDWWHSDTDVFQKKQNGRYKYVRDRFFPQIHSGKVVVHRMSSSEALNLFERSSLDWVYLDGATDEDTVVSDVFGYYDRIRPGGCLLVAGVSDDYPESIRYRVVKELTKNHREAFVRAKTFGTGSAPHWMITKLRLMVLGAGGGNKLGGDSLTFEPELWKWMIDRYGIGTVLDVGCGEGHSLEWFINNGMSGVGVDCIAQNVHSGITGVRVLADMEESPLYVGGSDLSWCCEVAEHIIPECVYNLMWTLAQSRVVAMTHALPMAVGHHHVNLQDDGYWIEKAENVGLRYMKDETELARSIARDAYFRRSGLIFFSKTEELRWKLR